MTCQQFKSFPNIDNDVIEIRPANDSNFYGNVHYERKNSLDSYKQNLNNINTNYGYDLPYSSTNRPPSYNSRNDTIKLNNTYQNYHSYNTSYYSQAKTHDENNKYHGYELQYEQRPSDYYYTYYQTPKDSDYQASYSSYDYQTMKYRSNSEMNNNQFYSNHINNVTNYKKTSMQQVNNSCVDNSFKSSDFISYNNTGSSNMSYGNAYPNDSSVYLNRNMEQSYYAGCENVSFMSPEIVIPDELIDDSCLNSSVSSEVSGEFMSKLGDVVKAENENAKKNVNNLDNENSCEILKPKCKKLRSIDDDELNESDSEKIPVVNCYFSLEYSDENENQNPLDLLMQDVQKQQLELEF